MQLASDERILWQGGPAWSNYLGLLLLIFLLLIAGLALGFAFVHADDALRYTGFGALGLAVTLFGVVVVQRATQRYTVTSQRAVVRRGLLSRHEWELELRHVRDIQLKQSLGQRMLRTGTLEVSSAGRDTAEVVFAGISNPDGVKELIRQGMRQPPQTKE